MMNVLDFQKMRDEGRKISMVTCYDYSSARAVAESNIDAGLVMRPPSLVPLAL
jgi:3-methyl-2-oxobutanoate hydroxymethyltransferase